MPVHSSGVPSGESETEKMEEFKMPKWEIEEDVCITGISGRFPMADNVEELKKNLYEGVDMITEDDIRWKPGYLGNSRRHGKLRNVTNFDVLFFGIHGKQAEVLDPMQRLMLESVYEAIFDAGYDPESLKGKNIGVYTGCCEKSLGTITLPANKQTGYEILGMSLGMLSNRVSFVFGFTGPSITMDTACSSTLSALNEAVLAIRTNRCEAAIVGGGSICLDAMQSLAGTKLGFFSKTGTCRVFDAKADGFARSETVGAIFLQRASHARRNYATVLHSKLNNDGRKMEGISFPSIAQQLSLYQQVYGELGIHPNQLGYLEAHGTGTVAGDQVEGNSISEFFCEGKDKDNPLLIGSIKSNLGHAEGASGLPAVAKAVLCMEEGIIPANLHYKEPNPNVPALLDGRLKVVNENTPWAPGIMGLSNFGFGGTNAHIILQNNKIEKTEREPRKIPKLILASGRNAEAVQKIFKKIVDNDFSDEALVLLEEACKSQTNRMQYRGYSLLQTPGEELKPNIKVTSASCRPVWFLFSGMGSQWSGMAKEMMKLDIFAESIRKSAQMLRPYKVNLLHLLNDGTEEELNHIIAPFVTIAAVQIALVDVMKSLNIIPDGIIGHSVGELGCAYADGCLTAEQMMMAAYWRGKCCTIAKPIPGLMAALGMTWEDAKKRCPEGVFAVCHNAEDSVTISGPAEKVKKFVEQLNAENVFARVVKTCDIAFHCKYISDAGKIMRKELSKVISNPLPRSSKWISSSVPEAEWGEPHAKLSSVEYHVNNLLSPVLFSEAMTKVPQNAIIIEFAPHSLLQAIVKRILGPESLYIGLMKRQHEDNLKHFLSAVGEMYTSNMNPCARNLYSPVSFPVPRGTAMLNSLIQWDHTFQLDEWKYETLFKSKNNEYIDTFKGTTYDYMTGHKVDGRIIFPFMGYVYLAWKVLADRLMLTMEEVPFIVEDFAVLRATVLPKTGLYTFNVILQAISGNFEISDGSSVVAKGRITHADENVLQMDDRRMNNVDNLEHQKTFTLGAKDFYKELRLRGYEYGPTFQGVLSAESNGRSGRVKWEDRWVSFMDSILQISILCFPVRALLLPTRVRSIKVDPRKKPENDENGVPVNFNPHLNVCKAGPVEIHGMHCGIAPKKKDHHSSPVLEEQIFVPHFDSCILSEDEKIRVEEYSHVCSTLAHDVLLANGKSKTEIFDYLNVFKAAPEELVQKYLISENKDQVLLNILKEIKDLGTTECLQDKITDIFNKLQCGLQNDLLTTISLSERGLRATLDIFLDNNSKGKCKVLEVSVSYVFQKDIQKMLGMTTLGLARTDYTVARVSEESIPENCIDPIAKVIMWDMKDRSIPSDNDLVVAKDILTDSSLQPQHAINCLASLVKPKGFILLAERIGISPAEKCISILNGKVKREQIESEMEKAFTQADLTIISKRKDKINSVIYLLRKIPSPDGTRKYPQVIQLQDCDDYTWVDDLQKILKEYERNPQNPDVWLVAENCTSGIQGLMNCLLHEPGGDHLRCYFNGSFVNNTPVPKFDLSEPFFKEVLKNDLSLNVYKNGQWGNFRHRLIDNETASQIRHHAFLNATSRGDLSSLKWIESKNQNATLHPDTRDNALVQVYYSGLNFRDVMLATGKLPPDALPMELAVQECVLGAEFAGRDENGRRVMAMCLGKSLASTISIPREALFDIPDNWTMEEASTVLVVYFTVYYSFFDRAHMERGQSVLIHSGTGGVGQSAIRVALSMGCEIFTTVGSEEKRQYLKELFPEIDDSHISNSRDENFEYDVLSATHGKGVDIVLNSLADDKLQASVRCLKIGGHFLEIGKFDIAMNSNLGMAHFKKNVTFHGIGLDTLFTTKESQQSLKKLSTLFWEGVRTGVVKPLKTTVFPWEKAEEAFRLMTTGKHVGKVVMKIRDEETGPMAIPVGKEIPCVPRTYCNPRKSYLVTGGLGGFGMELANWLVDRGARHIILSTRTGIHDEYQRLWIERWRKTGVNVLISNQDISTRDTCRTLVDELNGMAPVGGIFHLAMVLHDGLFENLKSEDFEEVGRSKVKGVHQLDQLSRELCPELEHFVVFSSISCGRGNPGQSNYGYANSVMERVVEKRKYQGLPGLAIQWGGIGDVGVVFEKMGGNEVILKGTIPQRLSSCLAVLDRLMQEDHAIVSSFVPVESAAFSMTSGGDIVAMLCNVLGIKDPSKVKPEMTLGELGMDSLMGVEIKQVLETDYDTVLTVPEVRQLTINDLKEINKKGKEKSNKEVAQSQSSEIFHGMEMIGEAIVPDEVLVPLNDVKSTSFVFFVHPLDGHTNMIKPLASNIKKKAFGLQFTDEVPHESAAHMATYYIKQIKNIQPHGPYHLVGYSFGTLIAFEMALQLQKTDQVKTLIFIDGSPSSVKETSVTYVTESKEEGFTISTTPITLFFRTFFTKMPVYVEEYLKNLNPTQSRKEILELVKEATHNKMGEDLIVRHSQRIYELSWVARRYQSEGKFRGRITLIKSTEGEMPKELKVLSTEDYELQKDVDGPVEVFSIKGTHYNLCQDNTTEVSKIINDRI